MRHNLLTNISILFVTVAICLVLLEVVTRIYLKEWWQEDAIRSRMLPLKDYIIPSENPKLLYELKKDTTIIGDNGVEYTLNETGERIAGPSLNGKKIAIIGDSTSFGWGIPAGASYPFLLETLSDGEYSVRNFSVPGYNTEQEREVYRTKVKQWSPDIVIIHHDGNDADPIGRYFYEDVRDPKYGDNLLHSALYKVLKRTLSSLRSDSGIPEGTEILNYSIASGPLFDNHIEYLKSFIAEIEKDGATCYVLMWDAFIKTGDEATDLRNYRLLHMTYGNIPNVIDPYMTFRERLDQGYSSDYWISPTDAHPNATMHRWIADYLIERIR